MISSNDNMNTGSESEGDLLQRLPAFYRENPGAFCGILDAVSETLNRFATGFSEQKSRWESYSGGQDKEVQQDRSKMMAYLHPGLAASDCHVSESGNFTCTHFKNWLKSRIGVDAVLWSNLRLSSQKEPEGVSGSFLKVQLDKVHRYLVIVWRQETGQTPRREILRSLRVLPNEFFSVGLNVQFAEMKSFLPDNPYVDGMLLQGELLDPWV